jgi:WD40 repeat protein
VSTARVRQVALLALATVAACSARPEVRVATVAAVPTPPPPASFELVVQQAAFTPVTSIAWSPDGQTIATNGAGGSIRLLDGHTGELRATLVGAGRKITSVSWSPDGATLASLGHAIAGPELLELWDPSTGKSRARLQGHGVPWSSDFAAASLAWSADGASVAVLEALGRAAWLWDVATGALRATLPGKMDDFQAAVWAPDGASLATMANGVRFWDGRTGALRATLREPSDIGGARGQPRRLLAWSPDGATLAALASQGKAVKLWDVATSKVRAVLPVGAAADGYPWPVSMTVGWSSDGATLVSTGDALRIWDARTGALRASFPQPKADPAWSHDGKTVAVQEEATAIQLLDVATGRTVGTIAWEDDYGLGVPVAWSPDDASIAIGGRTLRVWDRTTASLRGGPRDTEAAFDSVAWTRDGTTLAADRVGERGRRDVWLWSLPVGAVRTFPIAARDCADARGERMEWSPDGATLALAGCTEGLLWDAKTASLRKSRVYSGGDEYIAWRPDGSRVASAYGPSMYRGGSRLRVWDPGNAGLVVSHEPRDESIVGLAWSPDGALLASGATRRVVTQDEEYSLRPIGDVHVWDPRTGEVRWNLDPSPGVLTVVRWSPDGTTVAGGGRRGFGEDDDPPTVWLWDARTGALRATLEDLDEAAHGEVDLLAWSPDGSNVASSGDGDVRVWDAREGKLRATLKTEFEGCIALAWSPDGATLAAASPDATVRLWDARSFALLHTATAPLVPQREEASSVSRVIANPYAIAWSSDGRVLAVAGETVKLLRVRDGATLWLDRAGPPGHELPLCYTDSGQFDGDPITWAALRFRSGTDLRNAHLVAARDLAERFHRANLLADFLSGK